MGERDFFGGGPGIRLALLMAGRGALRFSGTSFFSCQHEIEKKRNNKRSTGPGIRFFWRFSGSGTTWPTFTATAIDNLSLRA
jgi:hypothetical protein